MIIWTDETRTKERTRLHFLRQQVEKEGDAKAAKAYRCLADYMAPVGAKVTELGSTGSPQVAAAKGAIAGVRRTITSGRLR